MSSIFDNSFRDAGFSPEIDSVVAGALARGRNGQGRNVVFLANTQRGHVLVELTDDQKDGIRGAVTKPGEPLDSVQAVAMIILDSLQTPQTTEIGQIWT